MINNKFIDILLVDHNEIFQTGIASALEPYQDVSLVGVAYDSNSAVDLCQRHRPDVVIVDIMLPLAGGANIIRQIRHHHPDAHIMVLTHHRTVELVHDAFDAGALSYLMKDITVDELVNAVREASRGNTIIAYEVAQALVKKPKSLSVVEDCLTAREQEVMQLLMKGYKNSDIAEELVITLATVKKHVRKILTKLDVGSRTEAVAVAYEHKYALG
jgi:DNA-binding NarL/FixJ family response regulator